MIKKLLDSGYSQEELMASGIPVEDVLDAQRERFLLDSRDNQTYKTLTIGTETWIARPKKHYPNKRAVLDFIVT